MGENCVLSVQREVNLENKGKNCYGTDFKIGVTATLPELSEWTLLILSEELISTDQSVQTYSTVFGFCQTLILT